MAVLDEEQLRAWQTLLRAHTTALVTVERALDEAGLPPLAWYDVLWALYTSPGRRARIGELARNVLLSHGWLSRLVDQLVDARVVRRERSAADGRATDVVLLEAGIDLMRRMWPVYSDAIEASFASRIDDPSLLADLLAPIAAPAPNADGREPADAVGD